jgi:hypothetical protein
MPMIGAAPEARLQFIKRSIELPCDLNSGPFYQIMPYQFLKFPRLQFPISGYRLDADGQKPFRTSPSLKHKGMHSLRFLRGAGHQRGSKRLLVRKVVTQLQIDPFVVAVYPFLVL